MAVKQAAVAQAAAPAPDERFERARGLRDRLAARGIHFAPIRHHSPACARAVRALIRGVEPAAVLVEGPSEYDALLPALADPATVPPVAILSVRRTGDGSISSFFPLADFSPEWVAVREAAARGVPVAFIDRPWLADDDTDDDPDAAVRELSSERYYAASRALTALARREHCRDHDELWEHLFELRVPWGGGCDDSCNGGGDRGCDKGCDELADARRLFDDVFAWAALARLDYEPAVLRAEGSVPREAVMTAHIAAWWARAGGPLVVVTGAFHTLALVEALAVRVLGEAIAESDAVLAEPVPGVGDVWDGGEAPEVVGSLSSAGPLPPAWLIRYDLNRLDALTGYGAGIRSPGFYQRQWEAAGRAVGAGRVGAGRVGAGRVGAGRVGADRVGVGGTAAAGGIAADVAVDCLADIARLTNDAGTADRLSTAEVIEAALQAHRLAELRGHPFPGRSDLLDACRSCFERGDLAPAVRDAIGQVFGGHRLGAVPAGTAAPPIVAEARATAERLRLNVTDSQRRTTTLDVRRSANARRRSRFLWLMSYLETGFAQRVAGPDYIAGQGLGRVREVWEYAWTPLVEAALVRLVGQGATLREAARHRLRSAGQGLAGTRSSGAVAHLVAQAALIGADDEVARWRAVLDRTVEQDGDLGSVLATARQL
ncbi:MAG: DUF5682 family protein, partial [Micrococcales bacterium]|nr:DUF5682 family protein [Micrococcales bacterium]